jgi:hypothetical protein
LHEQVVGEQTAGARDRVSIPVRAKTDTQMAAAQTTDTATKSAPAPNMSVRAAPAAARKKVAEPLVSRVETLRSPAPVPAMRADRARGVVEQGYVLKEMTRNDSMPHVLRHLACDSLDITEYRLQGGERVTLIASAATPTDSAIAACSAQGQQAFAARGGGDVSSSGKEQTERRALMAREPAASHTDAHRNVLTWTDDRSGRIYTLSGPVSPEMLATVRRLLGLPSK